MPMVPFNVTVSEAVFLAKKYSSDESRSFINGVLSKLSLQKVEATTEKAVSTTDITNES
jgi:transcription termination factor NusB